jgi:hypothetical protein
MSAVSENIVREYFELHEFLVRQHRKHARQTRRGEDDDIDFFVLNPHPRPQDGAIPFVLSSADLLRVERAIVVVKGWHTETFGAARLTSSPAIFRFVEPKVFQRALKVFGPDGQPLKILIVPSLPQSSKGQDEAIAMLRSKGVDAVIPFRTMLADLVKETNPNRNFEKSDLLQIIRILKNYDFFKEPQLELFKAKRRMAKSENRPLKS